MVGSSDIESRYRECLATLKERGQDHLLRWWPELGCAEREQLLSDIESIPWEVLDPLIPTHVLQRPQRSIPADLSPPHVYTRHPADNQHALYEKAAHVGRELIRTGKVAAFTVAGGQGTRLGFEGPKGTVPITPVRRKTLFQLFAETIHSVRKRYDTCIPWYIMTSPLNHRQTVSYMQRHEFFGLPQGDVILFPQEMLPVFDFSGRMMLADKHRLALAPDGHGGSLKALVASGALEDLRSRGVEVISYFQVDNPLVKPFDPLFIGLHVETGSEMSTKVTPKTDDLERVGNVCMHQGKLTVVEYFELPDELAHARNEDGSRKFNLGNLAIHALDPDYVDRMVAQRFRLPYRRAEKAVACLDEKGFIRKPGEPNAIKLETFLFDAVPLARNPLLLEVDRAEEFSPVKNARGVDSVETAVRDQIRRAARWLEAAGGTIPRKPDGEPDATIEIAPSYALDVEDVIRAPKGPPNVAGGETIYIA